MLSLGREPSYGTTGERYKEYCEIYRECCVGKTRVQIPPKLTNVEKTFIQVKNLGASLDAMSLDELKALCSLFAYFPGGTLLVYNRMEKTWELCGDFVPRDACYKLSGGGYYHPTICEARTDPKTGICKGLFVKQKEHKSLRLP